MALHLSAQPGPHRVCASCSCTSAAPDRLSAAANIPYFARAAVSSKAKSPTKRAKR